MPRKNSATPTDYHREVERGEALRQPAKIVLVEAGADQQERDQEDIGAQSDELDERRIGREHEEQQDRPGHQRP